METTNFPRYDLIEDRYKGTLLARTAYDGDNRLFSLALYIGDIKDKSN